MSSQQQIRSTSRMLLEQEEEEVRSCDGTDRRVEIESISRSFRPLLLLHSSNSLFRSSDLLGSLRSSQEYHMDGHENAPTSTTTTTPKYTPHPTPRDFSTAISIMYTIGEDSHYINLREVTAFDR